VSIEKISVVICTLYRPAFALQTVHEVLKQRLCDSVKFSILVVDQTLKEDVPVESLKAINELEKKGLCRWLFVEKIGLTRARNIALLEIIDPIIVFIDDDVLLPEGYLQSITDMFKKYPEVYGIAGPVYHRKVTEYPVESLSIANREHGTGEQFSGRNPECIVLGWKDIMVGCNHAVCRSKAIEIGGYDEGIVGGYHEDTDFTFRLNNKYPGSIAFNPKVWVVHLRAPSGGCRINKNSHHSEADKLSGFCTLYFRHKLPFLEKIHLLHIILRTGPLRKENVLNLRRQPRAWVGLFCAIHDAWKHRKLVRSPFI
jgi:GT2 family glycosyltransferase